MLIQASNFYTQNVQTKSVQAPRLNLYHVNASKLKALQKDVVSFTGTSDEDLLSLNKQLILSRVRKAANNEKNYMGQGGEARVYDIPNTPYCVRVLHKTKKPFADISFDVTPQDEINHVVAKLSEGATIMRKVPGYSPFPQKMNRYSLAEYNRMIVDMPFSAYYDLYKQITHARNHGMSFDSAWANLIINPIGKNLTAIDFYKNESHSNILKKMYGALMMPVDKSMEDQRTCAKKVLSILAEEYKPNHKMMMKEFDKDFPVFFYQLFESGVMPNFKNIDLVCSIINKMQTLKANEMAGLDVTDSLNGCIKVYRALLNQVFKAI